MKKLLITITVIAAIVAIGFAVSKLSGQQYDPEKANRDVKISWYEVNIRKSHSPNSAIVDTLYRGETVKLTGYSYEYTGDGENFESWVEVITQEDGVHGWIVTKSVAW